MKNLIYLMLLASLFSSCGESTTETKKELFDGRWAYSTTENEMNGDITYIAEIKAYNVRHIKDENGEPVEVPLSLKIMKTNNESTVGLFALGVPISEKGKIKITNNDNTEFECKYKHPYSFQKSEVRIQNNNDSIISLLKNSVTVKVFLPLGSNGIQEYSFNPQGLKWN